MELDTKSISILNKPPKTVIFRCLLTINHERQKPLFCPKTLARQALELQVFRPESLQMLQVGSRKQIHNMRNNFDMLSQQIIQPIRQ